MSHLVCSPFPPLLSLLLPYGLLKLVQHVLIFRAQATGKPAPYKPLGVENREISRLTQTRIPANLSMEAFLPE